MPRDLFGDVTRPSISIGNRKWYTLPVSLISHSAIVAILIALPILAPAVMPSVFADDDPEWMHAVLPTPPAPPVPRKLDTPRPDVNPNAAPLVTPDQITRENPDLPDFADQPIVGVIGGTDNIETILAPPPKPVPAPPQQPLRIGGTIRSPLKVRGADPVYPAIAQAARIQGIVIIEATISADGRVMNARILRSVPMLDQAAIDAVRQWEYTPTLLNGVPVPVIMTVTVQFTLSR
jgi:periplasmic protein TonB